MFLINFIIFYYSLKFLFQISVTYYFFYFFCFFFVLFSECINSILFFKGILFCMFVIISIIIPCLWLRICKETIFIYFLNGQSKNQIGSFFLFDLNQNFYLSRCQFGGTMPQMCSSLWISQCHVFESGYI